MRNPKEKFFPNSPRRASETIRGNCTPSHPGIFWRVIIRESASFLDLPVSSSISAILLALLIFGCSPFKPASAAALGADEKVQAELAQAVEPIETSQAQEEDKEAEYQNAGPRFVLIPANAGPGEPVTVGYCENFGMASGANFGMASDANSAQNRGLEAVLLDSRGRRLTKAAFFNLPMMEGEDEIKAAILAIPSTAVQGDAIIRIESLDGIIRDLPFTINSRIFIAETISLNEENTALRTQIDPQKTAESEQLWAILSGTGSKIFGNGQFIPPVTSTRRTSHYGDRRIYQYIDNTTDSTIHAGIDFGVPTGTEVRACAAGRVVLARPRIVTGNSVVMEHIPGVFSLYYHMDKIAVSEGMILEAGALLGESGSTGLATGPHLHWEIRVSGEYADPDTFISRPVLDKKDILNKMRDSL